MTRIKLLKTGSAADYIGVSETTLRLWAKSGKVTHSVTPTGRLLFSIADLDAMIRTVEPTEVAS